MDYYSKISNGYNNLYGEEQLGKILKIIKELKIDKDSVLDVGCGTALYSNLIYNYTGIDNSNGMLGQSNSNVFYGSAEELPFKDNSFDVVICVTAIHNFSDPKKAIKEINRVSRGKIAVSLLKRTKMFNNIKEFIRKHLVVYEVDGDKDLIFIQTSKS
mgnify:FL=1